VRNPAGHSVQYGSVRSDRQPSQSFGYAVHLAQNNPQIATVSVEIFFIGTPFNNFAPAPHSFKLSAQTMRELHTVEIGCS
jgi:hypothetical protein